DLYSSSVAATGVLSFSKIEVEGKQHSLSVQIVGANPKAKKAYMFAIDYLRIKTPDGFVRQERP
ncbi:hypothetical protein, partial [Rhodopirellula bahusiensis]